MVDSIERNKDLVQELVESTATHVGRIATIITGAVADVAREIGDLVTDGFEMRDAARRARDDDEPTVLEAVELEQAQLEATDPDVGDPEGVAPSTAETAVDAESGEVADDDLPGDPVDLGEINEAELGSAEAVPEEPVDLGEIPGEAP
ncbi:hypothetical protein GIY30_16430 [Gordonia sp. HNM0687]|uniref:Uncharacterized protein n=1 Tax=Gordonia mangrovi TaxID=2665643 RepID=A0A6L7GTZ8_9ACTN|nr:hypothetical protein [Gordonia mangrovi]MXP22927.1 hypothetical protein [Gordonia mangrovi]UVF77227.1 hypothetical protein NWF22_18240 [Gordonia mangrovi]